MSTQSTLRTAITRGFLLCAMLAFPRIGRAAEPVKARPAVEFLNSIGANSAIDARGETLQKTIECARYLGLRWFRSGTEGDVAISRLIELHKQTGVRFSWSPGSGGADIKKLTETAHPLADAGALLAFEGPNEPNNWGVTYEGVTGGRDKTWAPVAKLQRDLYAAVKSDPKLKRYPVFGISENGAEVDNVGLQFLTIPPGAGTVMPDGTRYADYANVHNYIYHPNSPTPADNKTWNSADPGPSCRVDGLYGEYGVTWGRHYRGYSEKELNSLPRVTTETGVTIEGPVTEEMHARNLLTLYLDQFTRGWSYTAVYLMRDRSDEGGNQQFGFYRPDYTPRKAAHYLHNLTTILADTDRPKKPVTLEYIIANQPETVHHLLLQKSSGEMDLVVWNERVSGDDRVAVRFDRPQRTMKVYDPTTGTAPVQAITEANTVSLVLSDHPVIIAIAGR